MSNSIPQTFLDELLVRTDIVELIEARVTLRKMGSNYVALCPFHTEKTPSFTVSPTKQFYYCFGCSAHGNAISFLMQYDRMEFIDAVESLASKAGLTVPQQTQIEKNVTYLDFYALLEKANKIYQIELRKSPIAIAYLKSRGVTGEIAKLFGLGYAPESWENLTSLCQNQKAQEDLITTGMLIKKNNKNYDRFRSRIMFPIRDIRGRVIAFGGRTLGDDLPKYLNSPETPIFHKSSELYGLYEARQACRELKQIIIVEGYMDVIALAQHDIPYAVATLGTATNQKHLQRLFRYTSKIIFCFDGDTAGQQAAWRALEVNLPMMRDGAEVLFMFLPEKEDPDSFIRKNGKENFLKTLMQSLPLSEFFFQHLMVQLDMNSVDGKAKLAALAEQLLIKIPEGVFKQLMYEKLSGIVGIAINKSNKDSLLQQTNNTRNQENYLKKRTTAFTPVALAISLLLQYPDLANEIEDYEWLDAIQSGGIKTLKQLLLIIKQNPQITTGTLLEYWRGQKTSAKLAKLASKEHLIPVAGIKEEFLGVIKRITEKNREQIIQKLLTQAKDKNLSVQEKKLLQQLISDKS